MLLTVSDFQSKYDWAAPTSFYLTDNPNNKYLCLHFQKNILSLKRCGAFAVPWCSSLQEVQPSAVAWGLVPQLRALSVLGQAIPRGQQLSTLPSLMKLGATFMLYF